MQVRPTIHQIPNTQKHFVHVGVTTWTPIISAYCLYLGIVLVGYLLGRNLLIPGAMLFLLIVCFSYGHYLLRAPATCLTIAVVLAEIIPFIAMMGNPQAQTREALGFLVKHAAFYVLILIGVQLPLVPLPRCPQRIWAYTAIAAVLLVSLVYAQLTGGTSSDERVSGLFANPNNLALTSMCFCCLIDDTSNKSVRWGTHGLVLILVALSGTAGAMMGYLIGRFYQLLQRQKSFTKSLAIFMLIAIGMLIALFAFRQVLQTFTPTRLVLKKIDVAVENIPLILSGREINYGTLEQQSGEGMTSGLWRLSHWRKTMCMYADGSFMQHLFGFGIGTSDMLLGKKPHNDYLRMLFELGLVGGSIIGIIWISLFRRMIPSYRWVFVMFATYALTENNADNFIAVTLFAFFVTSAVMIRPQRLTSHPLPRPSGTAIQE